MLVVAMAEPQNLPVLDELRFISGKTISPRIGFLQEIASGISRNYAVGNMKTATQEGPPSGSGQSRRFLAGNGIPFHQFPAGQQGGHPGNTGRNPSKKHAGRTPGYGNHPRSDLASGQRHSHRAAIDGDRGPDSRGWRASGAGHRPSRLAELPDFTRQDPFGHGYRRAARAAGRTVHGGHRAAQNRLARIHAAHAVRRKDRDPPAGNFRAAAELRQSGIPSGNFRTHHQPARFAAGHAAGHRADWIRQEHDALFRAQPAAKAGGQHRHGGRSGGIRTGRESTRCM